MSATQNQNFGTKCELERTICAACGQPVIMGVPRAFPTQLPITLSPSIPVYVAKLVKEGVQHVRPRDFFAGRGFDEFAALVVHDAVCTKIVGERPYFDPSDNGSSGALMPGATCDLCRESIVWSVDRHTQKRIPLDFVPIVLAITPHVICAGAALYEPAREWFDFRGLKDYALFVGHHSTCVELHKQQRAKAAS